MEKNAKKLEESRAALLAYMQEEKVAIDTAFVKGGVESSGVLPKADPAAFSAWLQAELGQFLKCWIVLLILGLMGLPSSLHGFFRPLDVII